MQCPHCHTELMGNPVTCPQCRQRIRSLSPFNSPSSIQRTTPPPADARPQGVTPPPADALSQQTRQYSPMPRATPGGTAPAPAPKETPTGKVGMILGYVGLVAFFFLPLLAIIISIVGLVFAINEKHKAATRFNIGVIVVSIIWIVISLASN